MIIQMIFLIKLLIKTLKNIFSSELIIAKFSKKVIYASISFMSRNLNRSVHSDIQELLRRFYPQINICLSYQNSSKSIFSFSFKDLIPFYVSSKVVYSYTIVSNVLPNIMAKQSAISKHALLSTEDYQLVLAFQNLTHLIILSVVMS